MKVAYLITKSECGGAQSYLYELMRGLVSRYEIALAAGEDGWLAERARELGARVTIIRDLVHPINPRKDLRACSAVLRWVEQEKPDLLHANSSKAGLVGRVAAHARGVPHVFTAHGWAFTGGASWMRKAVAIPVEWSAARLGGEIICVSHYGYGLARRYHVASPGRLHVIWNGIGDVCHRALPGVATVPVLTMVARFASPKRYDLLLHALSRMRDVDWRARLVGDGPLLAAAEALAGELDLSQRVEFTGARTDVSELLARADVFVLASAWEGLPISIIEAMRAGLPIVATAVGGIPELVDDQVGALVAQNSADDLAVALRHILANRERLPVLGAAARARYERSFTGNAMMNKTVRVYEACLARAGGVK